MGVEKLRRAHTYRTAHQNMFITEIVYQVMKKKIFLVLLLVVILALVSVSILVSCSKQVNIDTIEIYNAPNKTTYKEGEELDLTGAQLRIIYEDNTEKLLDITPDMVSSFDNSKWGEQFLVVSYNDRTASIRVNVVARDVETSRVNLPEINSNLVEGQNLNLQNAFLYLELEDGSFVTIPITEDMCSGFDPTKTESQIITVEYLYGDKLVHGEFNVQVAEKTVVAVEVITNPSKEIYYIGEDLNLAGGKLHVIYSNGYSEEMDMIDAEGNILPGLEIISWNNSIQTANSEVKFTYSRVTSKFTVKVTERDVKRFEILVSPPSQQQNLDLDLNGCVVSIEYNNNTVETVALPNDKVQVLNYNNTVAGEKTFEVAFWYPSENGLVLLNSKKTITLDIKPRVAEGIVIYDNETPIYQGTNIDVSAWTYQIVYSNGEYSESRPFSLNMVNWADGEEITKYENAGDVTWTIRATETLEVDYEIQILPLALGEDSIEFVDANNNPIDNLGVYLGGQLDTSGVFMKVTYTNGTIREPEEGLVGIPLLAENVQFDNNTSGIKQATVVYSDNYISEYNASIGVYVIKKIANVTITSEPASMQYILNQKFDPTGLKFTVNYENIPETETFEYSDDTGSAFMQGGWIFRCEYLDQAGNFIKTDGELDEDNNIIDVKVYLCNNGLVESDDGRVVVEYQREYIEIDVTVTNNFVRFTQNPFYEVREGSGDVKYQVYTLGEVLPGQPIEYGRYYVELEFEAGTVYKEITPEMVLDRDINNTTFPERQIIVFHDRVPDTPEAQSTAPQRNITVSVVNKSATGIAVVRLPNKTEYNKGDSSVVLDPTGIVIHLNYDNGTSTNIDVASAISSHTLGFAGFDAIIPGVKVVRATYVDNNGVTWETSFNVRVLGPEVSSIDWQANETNVYWETVGERKRPYAALRVGEKLVIEELYTSDYTDINMVDYYATQFSNLFVVIRYTDGTSDDVRFDSLYNDLVVEDYEKDAIVAQNVRLVYQNTSLQNVYLPVYVNKLQSTLNSISIAPGSPALRAIQGADAEIAGIKLKLEFVTSGQTDEPKYVPLEQVHIAYDSTKNVNGYNKANRTIGDRDVTIVYTFNDVTLSIETTIQVVERALVKVEINEIPKRYYIERELFDVSSGSITAYYDNGDAVTKLLSEATLNNTQTPFNISTVNFDSSEFEGYDKVQEIIINYSTNELLSDTLSTSYNVVIRNRKNLEVRYANPSETYEHTYGDENISVQVELWGYNQFDETTRTRKINPEDYTVQYIEINTWLASAMNPEGDYEEVPKDAGEYVILVTYNGGEENSFEGDAIHNVFQDSQKRLVIKRKKLYISFYPGQKKIYGTANPEILMVLKESREAGILDNPLSLFKHGDRFSAISNKHYTSIAYLSNASGQKFLDPDSGDPITLDMFNFEIVKGVNTLNESSPCDEYTMSFINATQDNQGSNYDVIFENAVFKVTRRKVKIVPVSLIYVYGFASPTIEYTAEQLKDENGNIIPSTGLYGDDRLSGALNKEDPDNHNVKFGENGEIVGYRITKGDLGRNNTNYEIEGFGVDGKCEDATKIVTILKRDVYIRAESTTKVYGEAVLEPVVKYYSDVSHTNQENVFASGDTPEELGVLTFTFSENFNYLSSIGTYQITPNITVQADSNKNYELYISAGSIHVVKRPVVVAANTCTKVFGDQDPPSFTYTVSGVEGNPASGLVVLLDSNGNPQVDIQGNVITEVLTGNLTRDIGESVGEYLIRINNLNVGVGEDARNPNYAISYTANYFTISKKDIYVTLNSAYLSKIYDGKKPAVVDDAITIFESYQGEYQEIIDSGESNRRSQILDIISINAPQASKNVGIYPLSIEYESASYNITFKGGSQYSYEITQVMARVVYLNLPDNWEYKGSEYVITARIHPDDLRYQYNDDGTIKTDENNEYLYDNVQVYLTTEVALQKGTYTTKVESISDSINYKLPEENNPTKTFTIIPRTLVIKIDPTKLLEDGLTFQREYNGYDAIFAKSEYEIENKIPSFPDENYPRVTIGTNPPIGIGAADVAYNAQGEIISHPVVILENSVDDNFNYVLAKGYKYRIIPKEVVIEIAENFLSKSYDQNPPTFTSGMFSFVDAGGSISLEKQQVLFTFNRVIANDGGSNSDAGEYSISVSTYNKNYTVRLSEIYFYTIQKKAITLRISGMERVYDGTPMAFSKSQIASTTGDAINLPQIRNFLNNGSFDSFKLGLKDITDTVNKLRLDITQIVITADNIPFAQTMLSTALSSLSSAKNKLNSNLTILSAENTSFTMNAYAVIEQALNSAVTGLNAGNISAASAQVEYAKNNVLDIHRRIKTENTYLAFEFGESGTTSSVNVGTYKFIFTSSDTNIEFALTHQEADRIARITQRDIIVIPKNITIRYGNGKQDQNYPNKIDLAYYINNPENRGYSLRDSRTGQLIDIETLSLNGFPKPIEELLITAEVGRYQIVLKDPSDPDHPFISEESGNYRLLLDSAAKYFYIDKAMITMLLKNHGYASYDIIEYGTELYTYNVEGYDYVDPDSSSFYESDQYSFLWEEAGIVESDSNDVKKEKLRNTYGGLVPGHNFGTEIEDVSLPQYSCYINPDVISEGQIFGRIVNVGEYILSAHGFSSASGNYEIRVINSKVKISRKALTPRLSPIDNVLTRIYGNDYVDLAFNGILDKDVEGFNNFSVSILNPDGSLVATGFNVSSATFTSRLLQKDNPDFLDNNYALTPTLPVDTADLSIILSDNVHNLEGATYVLANYRFSFEPSYDLRIEKRSVTFKVESNTGQNIINTVYGSAENKADIPYRITYTNLASHDTPSSLKIAKGEDLEPNINFRQNAGETILNATQVYFPTEVLNNELANYTFTLVETRLMVSRKTIYVYIKSPLLNTNNRMPVFYEREFNTGTMEYDYTYFSSRMDFPTDVTFSVDDALGTIAPGIPVRGYNIGPYIARITRNTGGEYQTGKLVYGQYGYDDFYAVNIEDIPNKLTIPYANRERGFVYEDTFISVFKEMTNGVLFEHNVEDVGSTIYEQVNRRLLPLHGITLSNLTNDIGTYKVKDLSFRLSSPNYNIQYLPMEFEVITQVVRMTPSTNNVILNSNQPNMDGLIKVEAKKVDTFLGHISDKTKEILTYGSCSKITKESGTFNESGSNNTNQNYYLKLKYSDKYALFKELAAASLTVTLEDNTTHTLTESRGTASAGVIEVANKELITDIPIRVYDETTDRLDAVFVPAFHTGIFTPGTHLSTSGVARYDRFETSIRVVPVNWAQDYSVKFVINGTIISGNYISLVFEKGGYGSAKVVVYKENAPIGEAVLNINGLNIFDGFTHDIMVSFDKRLGTLSLTYDYKTSAIINVQDLGVGLLSGSTNPIAEQSDVGFVLANTNAYLRYYTYVEQGYYDNFATVIKRINVDLDGGYGKGDSGFHFVLRDNKKTSATIDIRKVFSPYKPNAISQVFKYYINGVLAKEIGFDDEITDELATLTFGVGASQLEVYAYDNTTTLICSEKIPVLVDFEPYEFTLIKENTTDEIAANGGAMMFYTEREFEGTPPVTNPVGTSDSAERTKYTLTQYGTAEPGLRHAPLVRSMEFTMSFEEVFYETTADTYTPIQGTSKFAINMFMQGATYFVDDSQATYRGISLILDKETTESAGVYSHKFTGRLVFANRITTGIINRQQFAISLPDLTDVDFNDGALYTFGIYLDRDDIKQYGGNTNLNLRKGSDGLTVRVLRDGVSILDQYINNAFVAEHATPAVTYQNPSKEQDILSPIWLMPVAETDNGISISADKTFKVNLYNANINKNNNYNSDYLVNDTFVMRNSSGVEVDATLTEKTIKQSNGIGTPILSKYENAYLDYETISASSGAWEWHVVGQGEGIYGDFNKGMKLVYDGTNLNFMFYIDEIDYLAQPLAIPAGGLLNVNANHKIRFVFDRVRHSTTAETGFNVVSGGLTLTKQADEFNKLMIHYGKATVYIDNLEGQTVYFPYYNSGIGWYRTGGVTTGTKYQGVITQPTSSPVDNDENAFGHYPQFLNTYNSSQIKITNAKIKLNDYSSYIGPNSFETASLVDTQDPAV
jgi:hypothetical protein